MPYSSIRRRIIEGCWHGHGHRHLHGHVHSRRSSETSAAATTPATLFVIVYVDQVCLLTRTHLSLTKEWIALEVSNYNRLTD